MTAAAVDSSTMTLTQRVSWRLSPNGAVATCASATADGTWLEIRCADQRRQVEVPQLSVQSQLLPTDDGSVLMCHHRGGVHPVELLDPAGHLSHIATCTGDSAQLVATPAGALVLERTGERTTIHRVRNDGLQRVAHLEGWALGATALDDAGRHLAVNVTDGRSCWAVDLDLVDSSVKPLFSVTASSEDQVLDFLPAANLVVVSTNALGEPRIGYGRPGQQPVRFIANGCTGVSASYLGVSPDGERLAMSIETGAVSVVRLVSTTNGKERTVDLPPLVVLGRAHIDAHHLLVPVSTGDRSGTLLRLDLGNGSWEFDDPPVSSGAHIKTVRLPGDVGEIECVAVGDPFEADVVAVALHGGPLGTWRAQYDPLLAGLAEAGVAVIAPNIRGSLGYGRAHALAIRDRWGGPDLDDIVAVATALRNRRSAGHSLPIIVGHSYGAWLAILAAARRPTEWGGCVAVSPFVSGRRVIEHGGPVAELVRRLGGEHGPDLRTVSPSITAPTLVIHGELDTVVPVAEAELLAGALRPETASFIRLADCGHDVFTSTHQQEAIEAIAAFCIEVSHRQPAGALSSSIERR
jgi:pimeloyl-ACP methyl ester carboxylesterase